MNIQRLADAKNIGEALASLKKPGDLTLVVRDEVPRWLVMGCPDGCGETIKTNLDPRSGPAWRIYEEDHQLSLYPSIWRDTGCRSHFVIWRDFIWTFGTDSSYLKEGSKELKAKLNKLSKKILRVVTGEPTSYRLLAERVSANPWDVQAACERLASSNRVMLLETDEETKVMAVKRTRETKRH
jgi:hypothetical protein